MKTCKTLFTALTLACLSATALPASAAISDDEFTFAYSTSELNDASKRADMEVRLKRQARRYCRAGISSRTIRRHQQRVCQTNIIEAVHQALSERQLDAETKMAQS